MRTKEISGDCMKDRKRKIEILRVWERIIRRKRKTERHKRKKKKCENKGKVKEKMKKRDSDWKREKESKWNRKEWIKRDIL